MDENCLYLNIYAPASSSASSALPVYVWIYGGGYVSGYSDKFDGSNIAGDDIIVVTMNFRLGFLGLLAHTVIANNNPQNTSGFFAIQDQRLALNWIHDNVGNFGGDASRITLGGQSSGAGSVVLHVVGPRSQGLISQALIESATYTIYNQSYGYAQAEQLFNQVGCNQDPDTDGDALYQCLLNTDYNEFIEYTGLFFYPTADPYEGIMENPVMMLQQGITKASIPIFVGSNLNETSLATGYCLSEPNMTPEQLNSTVLSSYPNGQEILATYPLQDYPTPVSAYIALTTDSVFHCQMKALLDFYAESTSLKAYAYSYEHYLSVSTSPAPESCLGAAHGFELYYLWPSLLANATSGQGQLNADEQALAAVMLAAWQNFIKNGAPVLPNNQAWPTWTWSQESYVVLQTNDVHVAEHFRTEQCPVWGVPSNPDADTSSASTTLFTPGMMAVFAALTML